MNLEDCSVWSASILELVFLGVNARNTLLLAGSFMASVFRLKSCIVSGYAL
jgi:hypothetical protein